MGRFTNYELLREQDRRPQRTICAITETEIIGRNAMKDYLGCCTRYVTAITRGDPTFPKATRRRSGCTLVSVWPRPEVDQWRQVNGR